jgi:Zn-dependent alcohol dehydrogenase
MSLCLVGGIGLNVIQGARLVGADKIIGVDINPAKVDMAEKFGMTNFINPKDIGSDKVVAAIQDLTDGGADFTFDCTGNVQRYYRKLVAFRPNNGNFVEEMKFEEAPDGRSSQCGWAARPRLCGYRARCKPNESYIRGGDC